MGWESPRECERIENPKLCQSMTSWEHRSHVASLATSSTGIDGGFCTSTARGLRMVHKSTQNSWKTCEHGYSACTCHTRIVLRKSAVNSMQLWQRPVAHLEKDLERSPSEPEFAAASLKWRGELNLGHSPVLLDTTSAWFPTITNERDLRVAGNKGILRGQTMPSGPNTPSSSREAQRQRSLHLTSVFRILLSDTQWYCILGLLPSSPRTSTATCCRSDVIASVAPPNTGLKRRFTD